MFGGDRIVALNRAFAAAEYMSHCATDRPEYFSRTISSLSDEAWNFALQFTPFNKVNTALKNLEIVQSAMFESALALNAAKAGMESAMTISGSPSYTYEREQSKATSSLLNYSALYASYIDICRRIRKYAGQNNDNAYRHAIRSLIGKNSGAHGFIKGLRNLILHHHLSGINVTISYGEVKTVQMHLDSNSLLYSGFKWDATAREYIQREDKVYIQDSISAVSLDLERLIKFHSKIASKRLRTEKSAFEYYTYERERLLHFHRSNSDVMAAILRRPSLTVTRVLDPNIIETVSRSLISDEEATSILTSLSDRHKNIRPEIKEIIRKEIDQIIRNRMR